MKFLRFLLCLLVPALATAADSKPNIILILVDDMGINDLGCYGRTEHHTPNLDKLAGQGMRFTSSYTAQPICSPSRAAMNSATKGRKPLITPASGDIRLHAKDARVHAEKMRYEPQSYKNTLGYWTKPVRR